MNDDFIGGDDCCPKDVCLIVPPEVPDGAMICAGIFAEELKLRGYEVAEISKVGNEPVVAAIAANKVPVYFLISQEHMAIRVQRVWEMACHSGWEKRELKKVLERANAESWWSNFVFREAEDLMYVFSYITLVGSFEWDEVFRTLDNQWRDFCSASLECGVAKFFAPTDLFRLDTR